MNWLKFIPVSSTTETSRQWNFAWSKTIYDTFQSANNKGADQTARMRRLVCTLLLTNPEDRFSLVEAQN